jgi:hypothetical protein
LLSLITSFQGGAGASERRKYYPADGAKAAVADAGTFVILDNSERVASELGQAVLSRRIARHLRRRAAIEVGGEEPEDRLVASAVSGQVLPAGPQWTRRLALVPSVLTFDKPRLAHEGDLLLDVRFRQSCQLRRVRPMRVDFSA